MYIYVIYYFIFVLLWNIEVIIFCVKLIKKVRNKIYIFSVILYKFLVVFVENC